ncbi:MscS Mechanosensitive ion channel [Halothece sp. PCC 7418]|uniref:mechanosensitive ion channel family protein n=1 Tax=Halothece sp. (strain PCC 7418) TaxID=65093 RepID=UPI0002A0674A|nr:mechanosensitive ion channel domain-containing protein [Halothece sp. PCC 7418]AFZ45816.1 MscS Mechanosensitive ion channel [Halothece sp. PCC 7418]
MNLTLIDLLVIAGEVILLAIAFSLLLWGMNLCFQRLKQIPRLQFQQQLLTTLQTINVKLFLSLWLVFSLGVMGMNVVLLWNGHSLLPTTLAVFNQLSPRFWLDFSISLLPSAIAIITVIVINKPLRKLLDRISRRLQDWDQFTDNDFSIDQFFQVLKLHLNNSLWLTAFLICTLAFDLQALGEILFTILKIYLIVALGLLILKIPPAIVDTLDAFSEAYFNRNAALRSYAQLRTLIPFLISCLEYTIIIGTTAFAIAQIEPLVGLSQIGVKGIRILGIILAGRILIEFSNLFVVQLFVGKKRLGEGERKRRLTFIPILQSFLKYGIYVWLGILALATIGIDPAPILAAAGLLGLAVGLGAQNLVNDTVSGFFILFENYYLVGDYIKLEKAEGLVEAIELRNTRIRHPNGQLQIIRNGDIKSISNYSREYIYAVIDVGVAYDSDLNVVYQVLEEVGEEIQQRFPNDVLEPTKVDGLEEFGTLQLMVRAVTKLKPNNSRRGVHDDIQGELRKMVKEAFDREGIVIPIPQNIGVIAENQNSDQ